MDQAPHNMRQIRSGDLLLSASQDTNFIFEVNGLSDAQMETVNAIDTKNKIIDRVSAILQSGTMTYRAPMNGNFAGNLMLIDTFMDEMIAQLLFDYYTSGVGECRELVRRLEAANPLGYARKGIYEYKLKKFLCSVALGMMPSKVWDGRDEANGGYVIVKDNGDVVAYHIYNRDAFETYLLNNTKFEKGSTTKHGFASLYKNSDGRMLFNLNLQIRFV